MRGSPLQLLNWLAVAQFPLLYVPCVMAGLAVYGMNFVTPAGWIYAAGVVAMATEHRLLRRRCPPPWLLPVGAVVTAVAYRPLHMGPWDQQSVTQAVFVSLAGLFSLAAAQAGDRRLAADADSGRAQSGLVVALASLGSAYLCAAAFPFIPLMGCAVIMALAAAAPATPRSEKRGGVRPAGGGPLPVTGLFLLAADLSQTVYDYGLDLRWTLHLAAAMPAAAAAAWLAGRGWRPAGVAVIAAACANYGAAAVWPDYALHPAHAVAAGAGMGWALARVLPPDRAPGHGYGPAAAAIAIAAGMAVSFALSANLSLNWLRMALPATAGAAWLAQRALKRRAPAL